MAITPSSLASTGMVQLIEVSRSLAERINSFLRISKRKLSKIAMVLLLLRTPPSICKCFINVVLVTMNFMNRLYKLLLDYIFKRGLRNLHDERESPYHAIDNFFSKSSRYFLKCLSVS